MKSSEIEGRVDRWIVPPECQGQMIEVSYGSDYDGVFYCRMRDRSDGMDLYFIADADECGCDGECDCFDPANREPTAFTWLPCRPG